jgi:hypothetical protein
MSLSMLAQIERLVTELEIPSSVSSVPYWGERNETHHSDLLGMLLLTPSRDGARRFPRRDVDPLPLVVLSLPHGRLNPRLDVLPCTTVESLLLDPVGNWRATTTLASEEAPVGVGARTSVGVSIEVGSDEVVR